MTNADKIIATTSTELYILFLQKICFNAKGRCKKINYNCNVCEKKWLERRVKK